MPDLPWAGSFGKASCAASPRSFVAVLTCCLPSLHLFAQCNRCWCLRRRAGFPASTNSSADLLYTNGDAEDDMQVWFAAWHAHLRAYETSSLPCMLHSLHQRPPRMQRPLHAAAAAPVQVFWEAFPAEGGAARTTYMFAYTDAHPSRPSFEQFLDNYFAQLPLYQARPLLSRVRATCLTITGAAAIVADTSSPAMDHVPCNRVFRWRRCSSSVCCLAPSRATAMALCSPSGTACYR